MPQSTDPAESAGERVGPARPTQVIDLTGVPASVELRADVEHMAAEVESVTRRLAPLLRDATSLLAQVDRMVCDYAGSDGPGDYEERLERASRATGHDQLFDALQALSVAADAYVAVADRRPAGHHVQVEVPGG